MGELAHKLFQGTEKEGCLYSLFQGKNAPYSPLYLQSYAEPGSKEVPRCLNIFPGSPLVKIPGREIRFHMLLRMIKNTN